jgi:hypothetical protein
MYPSPHAKQRKNRLASVGRRDRINTNDEGSVDLHFGPKEPKGQRVELVPINPGEGVVVQRLYVTHVGGYNSETFHPTASHSFAAPEQRLAISA